jgi:5-methylcytosine-specific restriction protein A
MLARKVKHEEPLCRACIQEGKDFPEVTTQVDHITPLEQGGAPYDRANLQGLCAHHHSVKTRREQIQV